jgi:RNA polymerase primary sigma factor
MAKNKDSRDQQTLDQYFKEIGEVSLLKPEEEIELTKLIKKSDQKAMEKLVQANLRFVVSVAKEYQHQGLSLSDLISEGNIGLIKAAKRFDETRGFKFISYAVWWIRQSILQALAEHSRVVRLPLNKVGVLNKIGRVHEKLEKELERRPNTQEVAESMEMNGRDVYETLKMSGRHLSLEAPLDEEDGNRLVDVLHNSDQPLPDDDLNNDSLKIEIEDVLKTLSEKEAKVIKLYYGLEGERPLTLEEIGEVFNLTRERVRQIKKKAIRRLRHTSRSQYLRKYLD